MPVPRLPDGRVKLLTVQQKAKPPALVRATPKKYRPQYKLSNQMRTQVKKICNGMEETNTQHNCAYGGSGSSYTNHDFPGRPVANTELMRIIPDVPQGTERDEREGSRIRITNLSGQFYCHIPAALTPGNQVEASAVAGITCRLLILSSKQYSVLQKVKDNWDGGALLNRQFLKKGSDAKGFEGDMWSLRWPVNTELFTKHYDKTFTLKRGYIRGDTTEGATMTPEVSFVRNFRIKCKNKHLLYNDPANDVQTNWSPFAILLYTNNDSTITTGSAGPVKGNLFTSMSWKEN